MSTPYKHYNPKFGYNNWESCFHKVYGIGNYYNSEFNY